MRLEVPCGPHVGGGGLIVHVLDCGIEDVTWDKYVAEIQRLAQQGRLSVEVVRHTIDMKRFEEFRRGPNGSKATWARLLIPMILADVDKCVYSDCDMLFISNPIEMLEPLQDERVVLAGHCDVFGEKKMDAEWLHQKGLPFDASIYLCAGLVAMNLAAFRAEGLIEKCFDFVARYPDAPALDQTTLNQVCMGRTALLPNGWGFFPHECHVFQGHIKAIHYGGCRCWPWEKCRAYMDVLWLNLTRQEFSIWFDFEKRVLNLSLPHYMKVALRLRFLAWAAVLCARLTILLRIRVGTGAFQEFIDSICRTTNALAHARQELFAEG